MGRENTYTISDEGLEKLIRHWDKAEAYATQWQSILEDSLFELQRYNADGTPLTEKRKACIDNSVISTIRRNMSPYTTKSDKYIKQFKKDPNSIPVSKDNFEKLKEINRTAMVWRDKFNATVQEYKVEQQLYKLSFIDENGILDFLGWLER